MDVRVHGHHELGRRDRPEAEIDAVGRSNHPTSVENQALARTSGSRITDQVTRAPIRRIATNRVGETGEALPEVVRLSMIGRERVSKRFMLAKKPPGARQHVREVLVTIDAVLEPAKTPSELGFVVVANPIGRGGTQGIERPCDTCASGDDVSERKSRCNQPGDLLILRPAVRVHEPHGIVVYQRRAAGE